MHQTYCFHIRFLTLLIVQEIICERSFGNYTSLLSLLMKLCVSVSNYKDEGMNRKYAAEWISFHVPGSSGGQRSQWLWRALRPHGSIWKMIFLHFPFPCCPSSISSWSRGHPELLLEHRSRLSFWIKIPLVFGLQTFFPRSTGDECYYNIAQTLSVFQAVSITLWWSVGEFCKHLFVLGEQTRAPTALWDLSTINAHSQTR